MRTAASELLEENMKELWRIMNSAEARPCFIMGSGCAELIQKAPSMLNPISTFASKTLSWCLNLSSREFKVLSASYWIFMVLSCIAFFTFHWSMFLAFLIPALILNHMRITRRAWKRFLDSMFGPSTNGT